MVPLFERFGAWNYHSWQTENRTPSNSAQVFLNDFQVEKAIPEIYQIDYIVLRYNPYVNISNPQNTFPEYQQIEVLPWRQCPYLHVSKPEYAIPEHQQNNLIAG